MGMVAPLAAATPNEMYAHQPPPHGRVSRATAVPCRAEPSADRAGDPGDWKHKTALQSPTEGRDGTDTLVWYGVRVDSE